MAMIAKQLHGAIRPGERRHPVHRPYSTVTSSMAGIVAGLVLSMVAVGCGSGAAVDPIWDVELPFSQVDVVAVVGDAVFCLGTDADLSYGMAPCRMVIYTAATGAERFHKILDLRALRGSDSGRASGNFVLIEGTTAVVVSDSGRIRAFDATSGHELWSSDEIDDIYGSGDGYVFASDRSSRLAAFDSRTGTRSAADAHLAWKNRIASDACAVAVDGRLYVASGESIHSLDVPTWRERWSHPLKSNRTDVAVANGCVIATSRNGWEVIDAEKGALLWSFVAYETRRPMAPAIDGDRLLTTRGRASNSEIEEGYLRIYDLRTGDLQTRYPMATLPEPDAVVAVAGRLYLTATEPHYGLLRKPLVESTSGDELAKTVDCRPAAMEISTGKTMWIGEPASWGSLTRPAVSADGFVAVAAMTPKRNKPARLRSYRPVFGT
ncbi:MAG: PQQ-binding-like beta-propeller repeat protein [Blastocatellia bacterium]|nr:PQQ-binding-like beta-propeller repeat protein [Blastocatellia bacterium]MBK6428386.1 PQQ-binding-like beta-propeller repeat protein [Blastocatellia bacterium]